MGVARRSKQEWMLEREQIANRKKHWVRAVTACNSRCIFCLDMDTPRNVFLPFEEICADLQRGRDELDADKVIISGGEASLHPRFVELIAFARSIGYDRVQTVTNGWNYAKKEFYRSCINAGLGEITFSLHGHTPELHDRLTQHKGSFKRLLKGMVRAVRDPNGPIVNVDVVINKQNVGVLDKIVELCISLGVREFDLLHVIPQSEAFRQREHLFYDVRDHMDVLHKVFRLNEHPGFVIWTNRFPVSYLEGLEDLIQDPHKMLDEVNGRRFQVRRYLDTGEPLDCREQERCQHCFIEPFCSSTDEFIQNQNTSQFKVWKLDDVSDPLPAHLPYGVEWIGLDISLTELTEILTNKSFLERLPAKANGQAPGLELWANDADLSQQQVLLKQQLGSQSWAEFRVVLSSAEQLQQWWGIVCEHSISVEIQLNRSTAAWIFEHREKLRIALEQGELPLHIHQPSYEKLDQAVENDVRDPGQFFAELDLPITVSGLPLCLLGKPQHSAIQVPPRQRLKARYFDWESGRVAVRELARRHIVERYFAKSERCRDCSVSAKCDGLHINMIRDQGLSLAAPIKEMAADMVDWVQPIQLRRLEAGRQPEAAAVSLPGYAEPTTVIEDPLAVIAREKQQRQRERRRARRIRLGLPLQPEDIESRSPSH